MFASDCISNSTRVPNRLNKNLKQWKVKFTYIYVLCCEMVKRFPIFYNTLIFYVEVKTSCLMASGISRYCALHYADIYIAKFEKEALFKCPLKPHTYTIGIWTIYLEYGHKAHLQVYNKVPNNALYQNMFQEIIRKGGCVILRIKLLRNY